MTDLLLIAGGIVLLYLGGEALVKGAARLAGAWGVKPMVVGLTVVAFGTSSPELFASLLAALNNTTDLAVGNVIGSNIANVGLILGVTALITPISTHARFIRREVPFMVGVSLLLLALLQGVGISRLEGALLLALVGAYLWVLLRGGEEPDVEEEFEHEYGGASGARLWPWLYVIGGLLLLMGGAQLLVSGATGLARAMGVSELIIGLSLVAAGTSLPELFASVIAAVRKEPDIALGNVVGSNVLNILFVLGATALVRPIPIRAAAVLPDIMLMLALSIVLVPFLLTGLRLGRREAGLLLAAYAVYLALLFW